MTDSNGRYDHSCNATAKLQKYKQTQMPDEQNGAYSAVEEQSDMVTSRAIC